MDGDEIRRRRLALGLTQAVLAAAAEIEQVQLSRIERGVVVPDRWYFERIEEALAELEGGNG